MEALTLLGRAPLESVSHFRRQNISETDNDILPTLLPEDGPIASIVTAEMKDNAPLALEDWRE